MTSSASSISAVVPAVSSRSCGSLARLGQVGDLDVVAADPLGDVRQRVERRGHRRRPVRAPGVVGERRAARRTEDEDRDASAKQAVRMRTILNRALRIIVNSPRVDYAWRACRW